MILQYIFFFLLLRRGKMQIYFSALPRASFHPRLAWPGNLLRGKEVEANCESIMLVSESVIIIELDALLRPSFSLVVILHAVNMDGWLTL
jgi:hypothetical protein